MRRQVPRALVLSGSIGRGHEVVASVCAGALAEGGLEPTTYDCMELLGRWQSRVGKASFKALLSHPAIYDGFHFSHLRAGGGLSRRGDSAACRRIADRLEGELAGTELVLSVFATGAAAGAELARRHPGLSTVVFCTDATVHRMWVHRGTNLFVATSDLAARTVRRYRPEAEVVVIPAPVRRQFYEPPSKPDARARLGLAEDCRCVLLIAGGWGLAPLATAAAELAAHGYQVLAVAGSNTKLLTQLEALAVCQPSVHPLGFVDHMPELMAASDVVVSGAGQTCHEVRVVGRPLVLLDVVPGHGRENLLYQLTLGGALACSPGPEHVLGAVDAMLKSHPTLEPWPIRSSAEWTARFLRLLGPLGTSPGRP